MSSRLRHSILPSAATIKHLQEGPPGRGPHPRGDALSTWYLNLSANDRGMLTQVIRNTAQAALFNLLCMLDGVAVIDGPPHSELVLTVARAVICACATPSDGRLGHTGRIRSGRASSSS